MKAVIETMREVIVISFNSVKWVLFDFNEFPAAPINP
jgi:hypothetical protein